MSDWPLWFDPSLSPADAMATLVVAMGTGLPQSARSDSQPWLPQLAAFKRWYGLDARWASNSFWVRQRRSLSVEKPRASDCLTYAG